MNEALARIRHVALDMDGTIYRGSELFEYTLPFLRQLGELGIGHTFLTNNSSRNKRDYVEKLRGLGIDARLDDIYTSTDSTIEYLRQNLPDVRRIALLGTPSLCQEFEENGFSVDWESPEAVVVGFDTTLTYERLCRTAWWISKGLPYLATHPDLVCPTDEPTVLVDCGAICACLSAATGGCQPIVLGKPDPSILHGLARNKGLHSSEIAMVGDRLYTDVALAHRAGALAVLVLSGEAAAEDVASCEHKPDLTLQNVSSLGTLLAQVHREVSRP